jgi:hypothetical protein
VGYRDPVVASVHKGSSSADSISRARSSIQLGHPRERRRTDPCRPVLSTTSQSSDRPELTHLTESCPSSASQARNPTLRHFAEALLRHLVGQLRRRKAGLKPMLDEGQTSTSRQQPTRGHRQKRSRCGPLRNPARSTTKPGRNGRASLFPRDASSEGARRDRADRGSPAAAAPAPEPAGLGRRGTERRRSSG